MSNHQKSQSKAFTWISNLILWGGIAATPMIAINVERTFITIGVGVVFVLGLLMLVGFLMPQALEKDGDQSGECEDDDEPEVYGDWSARAKQRKRDGQTVIGDTVPNFPDPISSMSPKIREELANFPTFSPDEIPYDDSIPEEELVDDTLVFDSTGHGVDLEDDLFAEGLSAAFDMLEMEQSEWSMTPWGHEMLFSVEAILAAGGQPSRSRELGRMRSWAKRVHYKIKPELALELLSRVDSYMAAVREDPSGRDVNPAAMEEIESAAQRMMDRVALLL